MHRFLAALVLLAATSLPNGAQPLQSATQYTFLVTSNGNEGDTDVSDGACIAAGGGCTLRAAVEQANAMPGTAVAEIIIQVPEVVVPYPSEGFVITRNNVRIKGARNLLGCGTSLPVQVFGESGGPGTIVDAGSVRPEGDDVVAFTVLASNVSISGIGIRRFGTGIVVGRSDVGGTPAPGQALLSCLALYENTRGTVFEFGGDPSRLTSSAVYGNGEIGLELGPLATVEVRKNCIGVGPLCETRMGNFVGIEVHGAAVIHENIIGANDVGIRQRASMVSAPLEVLGNTIGTDWQGVADLGNRVGASLETRFPDGQPGRVRDNLISGNDEVGLQCAYCEVEENFVGVDATGRFAIPNGIGMVLVGNGRSVGVLTDNLISGNDSTGVEIACGGSGATGNVIGLDVTGRFRLSNAGHGIHVKSCANDDAGRISTMAIRQNTIAGNGGDGVRLGHVPTGNLYEIEGVHLLENRIHANAGRGIALAPYVQTTPAPSIDSLRLAESTVTVFASLLGEPNRTYQVEFFSNAQPDASGFGEGESPLGSLEATTNQLGFVSFAYGSTTGQAPAGSWITATATTQVVIGPNALALLETSPFSNAAQLLEPGSAFIQVEPQTLSFGPVAVGDSLDLALLISNNGSEPLSIEFAPGTGFYSNGFALPGEANVVVEPGTTKTILVRLRPESLGSKQATLGIVHDAPNEASPMTIALSGEAITPQPAVSVTPRVLAFGSVAVGTARTLETVVRNTGTAPLAGTVQPGPAFTENGFRLVAGQGPFSLAGGDSITVAVQLKPGSVGTKVSTLQVAHEATNEGSPIVVELSGVGATADARIAVEPLVLDFGEVPVGTTRIDTIMIRHLGGVDNLIGSVSDFGDLAEAGFYYASGGGLFDIAPGGSRMVRIAFSPDVAGATSARLKVAHNATNEPPSVLIDLSGSAVSPEPKPLLVLSGPDTLDFGEVPLGSAANRTVTMRNTGGASLTASVEIVGEAAGHFAMEGIEQAVTIDPGMDVSLEVTYEPQAIGAHGAVLRIVHDATNVPSPADLTLSGTGIPEAELGRPVLIEPLNGRWGVASPVRFRWNPVATAETYRLDVSTTSDFAERVIEQILDSTSVHGIELDPGGGYFWRVTARRGATEATSDIWSFTTERVNRPPVAVNDTIITLPGVPAVIDVLANDLDEDGDALRIVGIAEAPLNGIAAFTSVTVHYFPNTGFVGNDRFRYRIVDTAGLQATAVVYVTVGEQTEVGSDELPATTSLGSIFPNPLRGRGTVPLHLAEAGHVRISLVDALGQRVMTVVDGALVSGVHHVPIEVGSLSSGAYLCVLETGGRRFVRTMAVAR